MALALGLAALFLIAAMSLAWLIALRTGKSGWIDTIWSAATGCAALGLSLAPLSGTLSLRQYLVAAVIGLWSWRLASHIAGRTLHGGDDPRYAALKAEWGAKAPRNLFWFLQSQAVAGWVLAVAVSSAAHAQGDLRLGDGLGVLLALIAIYGARTADRQLEAFRRAHQGQGKVCDVGLWSRSRHPNYFFEWLGWCAYPLMAIDVNQPLSWGLLSLMAPLAMYYLLVYVSGIPFLEAHMLKSRRDAFLAYQARVPAFFPRLFHK